MKVGEQIGDNTGRHKALPLLYATGQHTHHRYSRGSALCLPVLSPHGLPVRMVLLLCLLILLSSCQGAPSITQGKPSGTPGATGATATATANGSHQGTLPSQPSPQSTATSRPTATATPTAASPSPTPTATKAGVPTSTAPVSNPTTSPSARASRPLLAFYYTWYTPSTWCSCHMSDLPTVQYTSSDDATIDRQLTEAFNAGITGFISSWWGPGDVTDTNFAKLLAHSATLENTTHYHFASSIYFESDAPALSGQTSMVNALRYIITHYSSDPHFFHWNGKPVLFFWDPLGGGRTLTEWASIRSQVDPNNAMIWSAEGVDMNLLSVFDGIHLFSAGYWGIQHNDMPQVDQGFRSQISTYNAAHSTQKIWAAGVLPGYNDTLVPGRTGTFIVPRNNGATYQQSWTGALSSQPDWITITSFNEWFEGSMIEPSVTYGNLYLNITAQYAKQWHG